MRWGIVVVKIGKCFLNLLFCGVLLWGCCFGGMGLVVLFNNKTYFVEQR